MFPLSKGRVSPQAHVAVPEGTYEEEHAREGFFGRTTHLYRTHRPTDWTRIEGPLKPRAYRLSELDPSDSRDPARGEPLTVLYNDDVALSVSRRSEPMPYYARNADGDELYFVHRGEGLIETDFGPLEFERGDYVLLPRGTTFRVVPRTADNFFLVIESKAELTIPDRGPLGRHAVFDPGVLVTPEPDLILDDSREWEVRIKRLGQYTSVWYPFNPMDVVGWKGDLTAFKLNVRDIRPVMSHRYHLPPSVHTTFLGGNVVVCTFVPRPFESDPAAMRVPFYHRNIDYDEVLFYHDGDFFSRQHITPGMLTLHPQGLHHGPHPQAAANAAAKAATDEVAVMLDTRYPLTVAPGAAAAEWADYVNSWRPAAAEGRASR